MATPGPATGKLGFTCRNLLRHLQHVFSVAHSDDVLKKCIDEYGLTPPMVQVLRRVVDDGGYKTGTPSPQSVGYVSVSVVEYAIACAAERLTEMDHAEMFSKDEFDHYLYLWPDVAGSDEMPKKFLLEAIQDKDKLLMLVRAYLQRSSAAYAVSLYSELDYGYGTGLKMQLFESFDLIPEAFNNVNTGYLVHETFEREDDRRQ